jgi:predicted RecB family nuclease
MLITSHVFEAYLKCQTKCFLRSLGKTASGNGYSDWVQAQQTSYRSEEIKRLTQETAQNECVTNPIDREDVQSAKWRFAVEITARAQNLESTIHAVEHLTSEGRDKLGLFIPIRFIFTNKLHKDSKLLLAFDAFVLSKMLGCEVGLGKIIHGDDRATLKVNTGALVSEVRRLTEKIGALLSSNSPPALILNRHCPVCEFQNQCRLKAAEKDDLSLLSGITETERQSHRSKGIFTVTQLSYTFKTRRAPKRAKNPAAPHHFALQALAIRENTVYIRTLRYLNSCLRRRTIRPLASCRCNNQKAEVALERKQRSSFGVGSALLTWSSRWACPLQSVEIILAKRLFWPPPPLSTRWIHGCGRFSTFLP